MKIVVYSGPGVLKSGIDHIKNTLEQSLSKNVHIQTISYKELIENNWEKETSLFILPGGADLPYVRKLNGKGNEKLRNFVESGGAFLGICAGSYFAGNFVEFALNSPIEVQGSRELGFFPGIVRGPIIKDYHYESQKGAASPAIRWNTSFSFASTSHFTVYYNGGGYFVDAKEKSNTEILAFYDLPEEYAAIVECRVGEGLAILSGVHFEYDHNILNKDDPFLQDILPQLEKGNVNRLLLSRHIFNRFGL